MQNIIACAQQLATGLDGHGSAFEGIELRKISSTHHKNSLAVIHREVVVRKWDRAYLRSPPILSPVTLTMFFRERRERNKAF